MRTVRHANQSASRSARVRFREDRVRQEGASLTGGQASDRDRLDELRRRHALGDEALLELVELIRADRPHGAGVKAA